MTNRYTGVLGVSNIRGKLFIIRTRNFNKLIIERLRCLCPE